SATWQLGNPATNHHRRLRNHETAQPRTAHQLHSSNPLQSMSITTVDSSSAGDRFDALTKASALLRQGLSVREIADRLVELCARILPSDGIAIWRLDA